MFKYIAEVIKSKGEPSSKRFITVMAFFLMGIGFIANMFFGKIIDPIIFDSMKWIVIGGLGFTASEKFTNTKSESRSTAVGNNAIAAIKDIAKESTTPLSEPEVKE